MSQLARFVEDGEIRHEKCGNKYTIYDSRAMGVIPVERGRIIREPGNVSMKKLVFGKGICCGALDEARLSNIAIWFGT